MSQTSWWKGTRGEGYVVIQILLMLLVFFAPRNLSGWPAWSAPVRLVASFVGGALFLAGLLLFGTAINRMGKNLTAVPYPKEEATLIVKGPYRLVRHPMYCGLVVLAFGWALLVHGWLTVFYAIVLLLFFDIKSRREEQWLCEKFPGYPDYRKRVKKLIPFIY